MLYDENSTSRAGGVLTQMEVIPTLSEELETQPDKVLEAFEQIRSACQCVVDFPGEIFVLNGIALSVGTCWYPLLRHRERAGC
jgi:hypothetical protein